MDSALRDKVRIVLCRPKFPENIGAAARAMKNMGFSRLVVVTEEKPEMERVYRMATHAARDVIDTMEFHEKVMDAVSDAGYVVGTTARLGRNRKRSLLNPLQLAEQISITAPENETAILFGPEDRGLENDDLRLCHAFVHIPTADFSSLNLAQAVMVITHTLFSHEAPAPQEPQPKLATRQELEDLYRHMQEVLIRIDFMRPDNPDYWLDNFRHLISRMPLRSREVRMLRGICRQIQWYGEDSWEKGRKEGGKSR
ncbi:tRNA/rRNA methyltransferase [Desulfobotulus alkaliphilus]|uniref:tRNA (cytidine/uridine-2'-O-)-methyltransferase TrmJ n=1 Tax=Desulfobotulus alkaliphilus TaxID=622671 RepID=A0A562S7R6_9BACT|nr:RNA methyltransferase [Desulfobotulus alkaliphilus]TWI77467.1 tRNA/rRNA methyltransferase [Desulfobotulus alkaliphilus]